ncbi:hypothetical protein FI667_g5996, partial [Globisporangium splendens]
MSSPSNDHRETGRSHSFDSMNTNPGSSSHHSRDGLHLGSKSKGGRAPVGKYVGASQQRFTSKDQDLHTDQHQGYPSDDHDKHGHKSSFTTAMLDKDKEMVGKESHHDQEHCTLCPEDYDNDRSKHSRHKGDINDCDNDHNKCKDHEKGLHRAMDNDCIKLKEHGKDEKQKNKCTFENKLFAVVVTGN